MKMTRTSWLLEKRAYWKAKSNINQTLLKARSKKFLIKRKIKNGKIKYKTLQEIFKQTQWPLFLATTCALLLQYLDKYTSPVFEKIGMKVPDDTDYITLLSAVAGIGGVFIGLYYAALSSVGSAIYAKVANDIRDLLTQERYGSLYMRLLSFMTIFCIILISLRITGQPRIISAVPIVATLSGIGIIAFVKLGQRAFNLFDPTSLSQHIFEELGEWIEIVKTGGYQWSDPSFQNHAHINAARRIETLLVLFEIVAKEPHQSGQPLVNLTKSTLTFLAYYENIKPQIPSESYWYPEKYKYNDWYKTSDSQISIAHQTATTLQPEILRNRLWVENRLYPCAIRCLKANLDEGRYSETVNTITMLGNYISFLAKLGETEEAISFSEKIASEFISFLTSSNTKLSDIEELSIAENIASLPISAALGNHDLTSRTTTGEIARNLEGINWNQKESIYQKNLPSHLVSQLEWLQERIKYEIAIESKQVTPNWYSLDILFLADTKALSKDIDTLTVRTKAFYESLREKYKDLKRTWLAAATLSREWEYWHKVEFIANSWAEKWRAITAQQKLTDLPWPKLDEFTLKSRINENKERILMSMAKQNVELSTLARPDEYPDYAGQFLHTTGELVIDSLIENKTSLIKDIFGSYIIGCLFRFDRLKPTAGDPRTIEYEFKVAASALVDLMEVSGYAKLLSELHQNPEIWELIKNAWDAVTNTNEQPQLKAMLNVSLLLARGSFEIPHRGVLRTAWAQKIEHILRTLPKSQEHHSRMMSSRVKIDHPSKLVRKAAKNHLGIASSGLDIFVACYYLKNLASNDFEPTWQQRELIKLFEESSEAPSDQDETGDK